MNFKGTAGIPVDEFKQFIDRFGGFWNGYTWIDQTTYAATATKDALDQMLFLEAERMDRCFYDPAATESERNVIVSELQGGENDPDHLLDIEVTATAFRAHPYRHPAIGWVGDLHAMNRDDLYGCYRRHYTPTGRRTGEPQQTGERRLEIERDGTTGYLKVAYHAPAVTGPDFGPMLVLDAALTGAKGLNLWTSFGGPTPQRRARLYRTLVDDGRAAAVDGSFVATADPYLFMVSATAADGTPVTELRDLTLAALDSVCGGGVPPDDVARVAAMYLATSNRTVGWFQPR
jgi:zinc protease